jgi:hypothetical protein
MSAALHLRFFNRENAMEQHPTIQDVADHFEQLMIRILLAAISRLRDEIAGLENIDEEDF